MESSLRHIISSCLTPWKLLDMVLFFSLAGYMGVNLVLQLVKSFGALIAVTVTTTRKAVTICLSFVFFAKPFTPQYLVGGFVVLFGIYLNVYSKNPDLFHTILRRIQRTIVGRSKGSINSITQSV